MARFIGYYRVSTNRQGKSGLGLEAQQKAVRDNVAVWAGELISEVTEIESGKNDDRPQLAAAIAACRKHKAVLVIAKLDRLARRVSFISALMDGDVDFVACDMPLASRLTLHILAAVAEHEREMISQRTKVALAAARARGRKLGNPRLAAAREIANRNHSAKADALAANVLPIVREVQATGLTTLAAIAGALNARGVRTARGGPWHAATVRNLLLRAPA
jgi:DNA invertase Pin-like site-specific DNA recombinase